MIIYNYRSNCTNMNNDIKPLLNLINIKEVQFKPAHYYSVDSNSSLCLYHIPITNSSSFITPQSNAILYKSNSDGVYKQEFNKNSVKNSLSYTNFITGEGFHLHYNLNITSSTSKLSTYLIPITLPEGIYIDIDEVKNICIFNKNCKIYTPSRYIDVELPITYSTQYLVFFFIEINKKDEIITFPIHLRYSQAKYGSKYSTYTFTYPPLYYVDDLPTDYSQLEKHLKLSNRIYNENEKNEKIVFLSVPNGQSEYTDVVTIVTIAVVVLSTFYIIYGLLFE